MTLIEFRTKFKDEEACRDYLFKKRFPSGYTCPKCGGTEYYKISTRDLYQCKSCRRQTSSTAGTVLHKTRIELTKWFLVMFLMATDEREISATFLSKEFELPYKTAWFMLYRLRSAKGQWDSKYILSGIVESDDTNF